MNVLSYYAYTANREHFSEQPTIIFIHGASMDHSVWALQSRYFAYHGYNVAAFDLPGHNLSEGEPLTSIEAMGDWLNSMLSEMQGLGKHKSSQFHLVGHSMGALICLNAAAKASVPIHSLSLLGFSYPMRVNDTLLNAALKNPAQAFSMMTQFSHYSPIGGEPNPGFWSPGMQASMMQLSKQGLVYTDLSACNNYDKGAEDVLKIKSNLLFLSGAKDKMAPAKLAKQFASTQPEAKFVLLGHCGHNLMAEKPDEVREILARHIGGVPEGK